MSCKSGKIRLHMLINTTSDCSYVLVISSGRFYTLQTRGPWWSYIAHLSAKQWRSTIPCSNLWSQWRGQFWARGIKWTNLVEVQNIKAQGLPLSEKKNSKICLLCSYARTSEPHGRTSPDPRGIVWINLVEVHKDMLHAKYQGSRPSSFREEELWNFHSSFLCSTYDPLGGASFDPRGILWTNLVEVHKEMPHTKCQISMPSSIREDKF